MVELGNFRQFIFETISRDLMSTVLFADWLGLYRLSVLLVDVIYFTSGPAITFLINSSYLIFPSRSSDVSVNFNI